MHGSSGVVVRTGVSETPRWGLESCDLSLSSLSPWTHHFGLFGVTAVYAYGIVVRVEGIMHLRSLAQDLVLHKGSGNYYWTSLQSQEANVLP